MPDIDEQIACIVREIAMRQRVYPRFIERGTLSKEKAAKELRVMSEVLGTLKEVKARTNPQGSMI